MTGRPTYRDMVCSECRQRYIVTASGEVACVDCLRWLEPTGTTASAATRIDDKDPAARAAAERLAILIFGAAWPDTVGRSAPYKRGVLDTLLHYGSGLPLAMPYALGSVQADAWLAGSDMARRLWKSHPGVPA